MQSLRAVSKLFPGILFLLLVFSFPSPPPCVAVTIEKIYDDETGEGFLDEETKIGDKDPGNDGETLGEARKIAFEHATSILEDILTDTNTIRISAKFAIFRSQADPNDPNRCGRPSSSYTVAVAKPRGFVYYTDELVEGDADNPGSGTGYPYALFEALEGVELNEEEPDIEITFSECVSFYYGLTGAAPPREIDFVQISLHEIVHGLGFFGELEGGGNFPLRTINIPEEQNGVTTGYREAVIRAQTIYQEQLYSKKDDKLFVDLTSSQRIAAAISRTGLLWEGTDGGRNSCSYGQRMAELKSASAKARDGKPLLHAPVSYSSGSSVIHTHENTEDIMEPFVPAPKNLDLTLGMLKDMGWGIRADGFPADCTPTGIIVAPDSGLMTTEQGGEAKFEIKLESEPAENVIISVESADPGEGVPDPGSLELTFTPSNWDVFQEVTIIGVDDDLHDGPQDYQVELRPQSDDRFYARLEAQFVEIRNEEEVPQLFIEDSDAEEGEGTINFRVRLTRTTTDTVTAQCSITGVTAQEAADYGAPPRNPAVTLPPGQKETTISVPVIDDNLDELGNETFTVTLHNPQNATFAQNGSTATGTIRDNDEATLHIDDTSAGEGSGSMNFTVRLSPQSVQTVTVQYSITASAAREGSDYEAASSNGTVTFAPGESRKTIRVSLIDDNEQEAQESLTVTLHNPQNATFAQNGSTATGTIRDNDQPPAENPDQAVSGGCTVASGKEADRTRSTLLALLVSGFAAFSAFNPKTRF